jgi:transcriptional regulator with XRE-family HTH domain
MDDVLGTNVRRLRGARNLTQIELAEAVGIHRSTLIDIEAGRAKNLALATVNRLAGVLGVKAADLLAAPRRRRTG